MKIEMKIKEISFRQFIQGGMIILLAMILLNTVMLLVRDFSIFQSPGIQTVTSSSKVLLLGHIIALILIVILIAAFQIRYRLPLNQLVKKGNNLVDQDLQNLMKAIIGLSQGDFEEHPNVLTTDLQNLNRGDLAPVVQIMNRIIRYIREMADELISVTGISCLRLCFVGADSFMEGIRCGEHIGEMIEGKAQVIIVIGNLRHVGQSLRRKGFEHAIHEKYPNIEIVEVFESKRDFDSVYNAMRGFIDKYPHLSGVYATDTESILGVVKYQQENPEYKNIVTVTHDLAKSTAPHIKTGVISAALNQNPIAQGHDPVMYLYNHITAGWQPPTPRLLLDLDVVTKTNVDQFWDKDEGVVLTESIKNNLCKPVRTEPGKSLRIVVLGRSETAFWMPAKMGVEIAAQTLEPMNVKVEWICPRENTEQGDSSADVYGPWIERLIEEKCDGISVVSSDPNLVPYINKAVRSGIPVVTWNSEPSNLGNLIFTIKSQSEQLKSLSETLALRTNENNRANSRVKEAMGNLANSTVNQNQEVVKTQEIIDELVDNISYVDSETGRSSSAAEETVRTVDDSTKSLVNTLESIKNVGSSVTQTSQLVRELQKESEEIDEVVELIKDIASRVNVLALNASIEATKAGEAGVGFKVVANEVRLLSNRTREAVQEVTEMILSFQSNIIKVEKNIKENIRAVETTSSETEKSKESIQNIIDMVKDDQNRIQHISEIVNKMKEFSENVHGAMQRLSDISQQNSETVEEVNESTEQMSTQLLDVSDMANLLQYMAKGEQDLLAKFHLKSG